MNIELRDRSFHCETRRTVCLGLACKLPISVIAMKSASSNSSGLLTEELAALRSFIRASAAPVGLCNAQGVFVEISNALAMLLCQDASATHELCAPPEHNVIIAEALQTRHPAENIEWSDRERTHLWNYYPQAEGCVFVTALDVTDVARKWRDIHEQEQSEAISFLAAGVAHEFKNHLQAILGGMEYALESLQVTRETPPQIIESMRSALKSGARANEIATALLTYGKRDYEDFTYEPLSDIVESALRLVAQRAETQNIEIVTDFERTPSLYLSAGRIQELILNLVGNACDAIAEGGAIVVSVRQEQNDVVLRVGDTGSGIESADLARIFFPFYSKKGVWGKSHGAGRGLGLTVCRKIVESHGGTLSVISKSGLGATFTARFPVLDRQTHDIQSPAMIAALTLSKPFADHFRESATITGAEFEWLTGFEDAKIDSHKRPLWLILDGAFPSAAEIVRAHSWAETEGVLAILANTPADVAVSHLARLFSLRFQKTPSLDDIFRLIRLTGAFDVSSVKTP